MKLSSVFKAPEGSVTVGLAEAAVVFTIYTHLVPNHTDIRAAQPHDADVEASRKKAAWLSAAFVGLVFLITQDTNSALIGAAAVGGIDFCTKHANGVNPQTGQLAGRQGRNPVDNDVAFGLPDYSVPDDAAELVGSDY